MVSAERKLESGKGQDYHPSSKKRIGELKWLASYFYKVATLLLLSLLVKETSYF
jgi:hypothetical protein